MPDKSGLLAAYSAALSYAVVVVDRELAAIAAEFSPDGHNSQPSSFIGANSVLPAGLVTECEAYFHAEFGALWQPYPYQLPPSPVVTDPFTPQAFWEARCVYRVLTRHCSFLETALPNLYAAHYLATYDEGESFDVSSEALLNSDVVAQIRAVSAAQASELAGHGPAYILAGYSPS